MKITKKTFSYTAVIILVLVIAYFSSGASFKTGESYFSTISSPAKSAENQVDSPALKPVPAEQSAPSQSTAQAVEGTAPTANTEAEKSSITGAPTAGVSTIGASTIGAPTADAQSTIAPGTTAPEKTSKESSPSPAPAQINIEKPEPGATNNEAATELPPAGPAPVDPQESTVSDKELTCFLSISCHTIIQNMENLNPEKIELIPYDGIIFYRTEVVFYEGESVFNVLQREMKKNKIHMEFVRTPMYNSAYIEGMGNLYEFDCSPLSGWMYKVNGWFPNYGCSRYQLSQGDEIEWVYTCDLGRDVGDQFFNAGAQKQ